MGSVSCKSWVAEIAPYQAGESQLHGIKRAIKLSSNESVLGPSPHVVHAIQASVGGIARYPDPHCVQLRKVIASAHNICEDWIVCSNGSEELLDLLARAYAGPGDDILYFDQSFPRYEIAARAVGAQPIVIPVEGFQPNVADIASYVTDRTRLMYVANPNNPTGVWLTEDEVRTLREILPDDVLLVLDAAYAEFVDDPAYGSGFDIVQDFSMNTILTRTFSKAYGLAGMRVGWAYGAPDILAPLNAVRGAFNVSTLAQAAAVAAVKDGPHLRKVLAHNAAWKPELEVVARQAGLTCPARTAGNFIFLTVPRAMGGPQSLDEHLRAQGIISRVIPTTDGIRTTIGTADENKMLAEALRSFAKACSASITKEMAHG